MKSQEIIRIYYLQSIKVWMNYTKISLVRLSQAFGSVPILHMQASWKIRSNWDGSLISFFHHQLWKNLRDYISILLKCFLFFQLICYIEGDTLGTTTTKKDSIVYCNCPASVLRRGLHRLSLENHNDGPSRDGQYAFLNQQSNNID